MGRLLRSPWASTRAYACFHSHHVMGEPSQSWTKLSEPAEHVHRSSDRADVRRGDRAGRGYNPPVAPNDSGGTERIWAAAGTSPMLPRIALALSTIAR